MPKLSNEPYFFARTFRVPDGSLAMFKAAVEDIVPLDNDHIRREAAFSKEFVSDLCGVVHNGLST